MKLKGYTTIPDWMLAIDIDLYEIIILATIYGFSQDGDSAFKGSQAYLALKAKCSRRKVAMALARLLELDLIVKRENNLNGVRFCEYKVSTMCIGYARDAQGYARDAHKNIEENIDINKISLHSKGAAAKFVKPTLTEVEAYCTERGNGIDAEAFIAHYESNGWMVGSNPMKDWRQAIITWEKKERSFRRRPYPTRQQPSKFEQSMKEIDAMFGTNYHAQMYGGQGNE